MTLREIITENRKALVHLAHCPGGSLRSIDGTAGQWEYAKQALENLDRMMRNQRDPIEHDKKCWPEMFASIQSGQRTADVRADDDYQKGDTVLLREYKPMQGQYTGSWVRALIVHILEKLPHGAGLDPGFVILTYKYGQNYSGFDSAFAGKYDDETREAERQKEIAEAMLKTWGKPLEENDNGHNKEGAAIKSEGCGDAGTE